MRNESARDHAGGARAGASAVADARWGASRRDVGEVSDEEGFEMRGEPCRKHAWTTLSSVRSSAGAGSATMLGEIGLTSEVTATAFSASSVR